MKKDKIFEVITFLLWLCAVVNISVFAYSYMRYTPPCDDWAGECFSHPNGWKISLIWAAIAALSAVVVLGVNLFNAKGKEAKYSTLAFCVVLACCYPGSYLFNFLIGCLT